MKTKKTINTKEALDRLEIPVFELIRLVRELKIPAFTLSGNRVRDESYKPDRVHRKEEINEIKKARRQLTHADIHEQVQARKRRHYMDLSLDGGEDQNRETIDEFMSFLFYESDLEKFQDKAKGEAPADKPSKYSYPQEVINLLKKAKPEIDDLYEAMKTNKREPDQEIQETYESCLKDVVEEYFDKVGSKYKMITKKQATDYHVYFPNTDEEIPDQTHTARNFKGKLCQVLISDSFPKYIKEPSCAPKGYGIKLLHDFLNTL